MSRVTSDPISHPAADRRIDQAYARLRREVISCEIAPGTEVSEAQIALRHGLGKAAARAALMRLTQEGLSVVHPRRGYQIAPVTIRDVREIFELRALLEPEAVRLAVPRVDVAAMREFDAVCARGFAAGDPVRESSFLRANREFHLTIIRGCGNERLIRLLENLIDQMERLFRLGLALSVRRAELRDQHTRLIDAVSSGDADGAGRIAADHIETMRLSVVEGVMASGDVALPAPPEPRLRSVGSRGNGVRAGVPAGRSTGR